MPRFVLHMAIAVVALACATPASAQVATTPAMKQLIAAADKEGELLLTWSSGTLGGARGAKAFESAINKAYGTKIRIKFAPGPSMSNVGNQIAMRFQSNLPAQTDVYMAFSRTYGQLLKHDMFLTAPWAELDPARLTDQIVERDAYVKIVSMTLGWSYNHQLAPGPAAQLNDFLRPEWKGKIATSAGAEGFDQIGAKEAWGFDRAVEFAKRFSQNVGGFTRCNEIERLITGEFVALVTDCGGNAAREVMEKGAPLTRVLDPDVPLISYYYLAVPKNAQHPNVGKLFVAFAASKEGQQVIREQWYGDLHLFPESDMGKEVQVVEAKRNFKFKNADIAWQVINDEGNSAQKAAEKILQRDTK